MRSVLSIAMIVRDEADMLPRFLAHAEPLGAELVVVDTGSRDRTVEILRERGARIAFHTWDDDFAAARNAGLALCERPWILVLDADEMISQQLIDDVRRVVADPSVGAATIVMRNQFEHGNRRESHLLRLFRNHPSVRFRYRIHEDIGDAVRARLTFTGQRLVHLAGHADHLGYDRTRILQKDKFARDTRLLRRLLADDPEDLYSHYKLLEQAFFWNDAVLAAEAAEGARALLVRTPTAELAHAYFAGPLVVLIASALHRDTPRSALRWLDAWEPLVPPSAELYFQRGSLHERLNENEAARQDFWRCFGLVDTTRDVQLCTVRPRLGLARIAWMESQLAVALAWVESALQFNPRDLEGLLAGVALSRAIGGDAGCRRWVDDLVEGGRSQPELDWAVGEDAWLRGDVATTATYMRRAHLPQPGGPASERLAQALLAQGAIDEARALAQTLVELRPSAGIGVVVCDLLAGREAELELDLELAEAEVALAEWTRAAVLSRRPAWDAILQARPPRLVEAAAG